MPFTPRPWMKPDDLFLFDLDQLPWPVFVRLVEAYFQAQNLRVSLLSCGPNEAELLLYRDDSDQAFALLKCCHGRRMIDVDHVLKLQQKMDQHQAQLGFLVTPGRLTDRAYALSVNRPLQLLGGNRLRAKIENLHEDLRRKVLDSIAGVATRDPD